MLLDVGFLNGIEIDELVEGQGLIFNLLPEMHQRGQGRWRHIERTMDALVGLINTLPERLLFFALEQRILLDIGKITGNRRIGSVIIELAGFCVVRRRII